MAEFPALPLFTDAYLADTRHLSTIEHGAYLLLLMEAWRRPNCSLPDNDALLARLAGMTIEEFSEVKENVMAFWNFDGRGKVWTQKRLLKERGFVADKSRKQRDKAKSRWKKTEKDDATAMPEGMPDGCRSDAGPMPEGMPDGCPGDAPTPTPTPTLNTLDADASNDAAGVDQGKSEFQIITDRIWADAPAFLASRGVPEKQARPVIGKWLKAHQPHDVDRALKAAADSPTRDPIPYVEAILQGDKDDIRAAFKRFWAAYPDGPNKTDQPLAMRVFIEIVTGRRREIDKTDPETIIAAAKAMPRGDRFTPAPTRWLEGARWLTPAEGGANGTSYHPYAGHPVLGQLNPASPTFKMVCDQYFSVRPAEDREWNHDRRKTG